MGQLISFNLIFPMENEQSFLINTLILYLKFTKDAILLPLARLLLVYLMVFFATAISKIFEKIE